jgi:hypothetical protein
MTPMDYATLLPLHHAAVAALEAGDDATQALQAFAEATPRDAQGTPRANIFASVLLVAACGSPRPGALQALLDTGLLVPASVVEGDKGANGTVMTHSALRSLHPAQVDTFVGFVSQDLVAVMANPKCQTAWEWFNWATCEDHVRDLCLAFGLSHNLKSNMDPDRDGPFTVYPEPRDSVARATTAAQALATFNHQG